MGNTKKSKNVKESTSQEIDNIVNEFDSCQELTDVQLVEVKKQGNQQDSVKVFENQIFVKFQSEFNIDSVTGFTVFELKIQTQLKHNFNKKFSFFIGDYKVNVITTEIEYNNRIIKRVLRQLCFRRVEEGRKLSLNRFEAVKLWHDFMKENNLQFISSRQSKVKGLCLIGDIKERINIVKI